MKVKVREALETQFEEDIKMPLVTKENACYDFYSPQKMVIYKGSIGVKVPTGLQFEIPEGYCMKLYLRSSYAAKRGLRLANSVGMIDSGYRGEVMAIFDNIGEDTEVIEKGERFLQGRIEKNILVEFEEVTTLEETQRGDGGFGSTGKM